jgi:tRNA(Leu) C34 or U34 (ribose-2'-O)-methylase TrmL
VRGYACIGLDNPKSNVNVGSALRAAAVFGASMVAVAGLRYKRTATDTPKAYKHLPLLECDNLHDVIPFDCVPVAVDMIPGAQSLESYVHPERAFYVFGAEDATLGVRVLSWCRDVVYVSTPGPCMNLAAAVNVVLYDRLAKQQRHAQPSRFMGMTVSDEVHGRGWAVDDTEPTSAIGRDTQ